MQSITANQALTNLPFLINEAARTHQPIVITQSPHNAVLVAEEEWEAIQETLNLLTIPGMRESIREGFETSLESCATELNS